MNSVRMCMCTCVCVCMCVCVYVCVCVSVRACMYVYVYSFGWLCMILSVVIWLTNNRATGLAAGNKGIPGPVGRGGHPGLPEDRGDPGLQGNVGDDGLPGSKGDNGKFGEPGNVDLPGPQDLPGSKAERGNEKHSMINLFKCSFGNNRCTWPTWWSLLLHRPFSCRASKASRQTRSNTWTQKMLFLWWLAMVSN